MNNFESRQSIKSPGQETILEAILEKGLVEIYEAVFSSLVAEHHLL